MARKLTRTTSLLIVVMALFLTVAGAGDALAGTVWFVDDDAPNDPGPGDPLAGDPAEAGSSDHPFDAIQEALDAAFDGDTIIVRDGIYTGDGNRNIDFGGKAVHLRSENGPENCVIDCQGMERGRRRGFYFHSGEDENSVVDGFTVTRGSAFGEPFEGSSGGGFYCGQSSPTIINNIITGNRAVDGAGVNCYQSSPAIRNNTITGNTATEQGGGISCYESSPTISNNMISRNTSFVFGGGIACSFNSLPTITNNTIVANRANEVGAGIASVGLPSPVITNCVLWNEGDDLYQCTASYSCIRDGDEGPGNITAYPYFVDPANGDYHLRSYSPCIDAGDDSAVSGDDLDIDGEARVLFAGVDIGADEVTAKSADADGDGLPDDWEVAHFGDTAAGPGDDLDGDGLTNLQEYERATDPIVDSRIVYVSAANSADSLADGTSAHPFPSIQQGIDAASEKVHVAEGTYTETLVLDNKILDIEGGFAPDFSESDPAGHTTTIDAAGLGSVVSYFGVSAGSLSGFTITGGKEFCGGGIHCYKSSPVITNNIITGNAASEDGGGIYCSYNSSPVITSNTITANTAARNGGGSILPFFAAHSCR